MKFLTKDLLKELSEITKSNLEAASCFKTKTDEELNARLSSDSWSILECLEHLNRYGNFYLPEIKNRMESHQNTQPDQMFKSGLIGNFFADSMRLKNRPNKMKAFKSMDPIHSTLTRQVLTCFTDQQREMLELLEKARSINLNTIKTNISITKLLKLKLGDTFRFVIYHNQRHVVQAQKVLRYRTDNNR